jgi:hypothetical protein
LWNKAVVVGRDVIWLHTYGEKFLDEVAGRPLGPPPSSGPSVIAPISSRRADMPREIKFDVESETLLVGSGRVGPVSFDVWNYQVSGMRVVEKWFAYRSENSRGRRSSELDDLKIERWTAALTEDLLDLLTVLERCVALESTQSSLLDLVCGSTCITTADLRSARILPVPASSRKPIMVSGDDVLI